MMKFLGFLFLVALAVGGYGYWSGWFEVSKSEADGKTRFGVTIDNEKLSHDVDAVMKKARGALDSLEQKIAELRTKASTATAENKAKLEKQIADLEQKKGAAVQELNNTKDATVEKASDLQRRLEQMLKQSSDAVEKDGQ